MSEAKEGWPEGLRRTKQRECVLAVLERAERPLTALEICAEIEKEGQAAWLSTVYRSLELFEQKSMVDKIAVAHSDMAVYARRRPQHRHYAVCLGCHRIVSMENCPMECFVPKIREGSFRVTGHNLEVYGYCRDCKGKH